MARIKVEVYYYPREEGSYAWEHRKLGERVDIKEEEIAEIAKRLGVAINIKETKKLVFFLPKLSERDPRQVIPRARKTTITIVADEELKVRDCVRTLLKTYGVPDEVSKGLWGKKNKGDEIVQSVLKELGFTSFGLV